jgi:peroxiredoxin
MIKKLALFALAACLLAPVATPAFAAVEPGKPAPDFSVTDYKGQPFKLSDHKGKVVVLEWTNHQCPFVVKHYETGNMQKVQKDAAEKGVAWVSIVSSAPGKQGNVTPEEAQKIVTDVGATITTKILDTDGTVGKLYGASTTPQMVVIDKDGNVAYYGAIDDDSSANPEAVKTAKNHVTAAIDDLVAGRAVATAQTQPYGCGVKYAD